MDAAHDAIKQSNNPFWIYSTNQYSSVSCCAFLLEAQQRYQLDINILLYIGWLATKNKSFEAPTLIASEVFEWQLNVVHPIRELRKRVKKLNAAEFYQNMKNLELEAEYQEQLKLYKVASQVIEKDWGFSRFIQEGCDKYFMMLEQDVDRRWLQTLIKHLQPK